MFRFMGSSYQTRADMTRAIAVAWLYADGQNTDEFVAAQSAADSAAECMSEWHVDSDADELTDAFADVIWFARERNENAIELARQDAIADAAANYPGAAREVWGGWVWVVDGNEQRWSKRQTRAECVEAVYDVVERLGIESAFDLALPEQRVRSLLDGYHFSDVVACATAQEFADFFYHNEFVADPAPDGRDDDLSVALIERMAKAHWEQVRAGYA